MSIKDLHIHTVYSDGQYDEYQIIEMIKKANVDEFAICDHDTIEGSKKVYELIKSNKEIIFHSGIELSCRINEINEGINIHLLYRDFDFDNEVLMDFIKQVSYFRKIKINRMIELVKKNYGIEIKQEEVEEILSRTKSFGKPHIYEILSKHGNYDREQFYSYMNKLYTKDLKLDAVRVLKELSNYKGYITLAHPIEIMKEYNLEYNDIDKIVKYLSNFGLKGLETKHSKHQVNEYYQFSKIAKKYDLIETEGSDYHGERVKPDVRIGVCLKTI